jgi:hypothetical protein
MNLRNTKEKVYKLLMAYPELRDSDFRLIVQIWRDEIPYEDMSGEDVLRAIAMGQVTNPENIRRTRQKLNEYDVKTRGESYKRRQLKETVIRGEIINL